MMNRYFIKGWRTPHGPVRLRLRKRAQRMLVKSLVDSLNGVNGFALTAVILYMIGYKNSGIDFESFIDSQDFFSDDFKEELKRAYRDTPEQIKEFVLNFLQRSGTI